MNIYIDESIHDKYDFMLLSFVFCKHDPQDDLQLILSEYDIEEFHACTKMRSNAIMQKIRSSYSHYVNSQTKWGVFILPSSLRHNIFDEFSSFVSHLETLNLDEKLNIYVDNGIISCAEADIISKKSHCTKVYNSDSAEVKGIQLADLVAAQCGVRLREKISGNPKMLVYGDDCGYDPPIEAPLGYELWVDLRYSMYRPDNPIGDDFPDMATFNTTNYGFLLSQHVPNTLAEKAKEIFGDIYLGCIH